MRKIYAHGSWTEVQKRAVTMDGEVYWIGTQLCFGRHFNSPILTEGKGQVFPSPELVFGQLGVMTDQMQSIYNFAAHHAARM